jgi:hypothetical protein
LYSTPKSGGTGSLHNHLKNKHPLLATELAATDKSQTSSNSVMDKFLSIEISRDPITQENFKVKLLNHIVCSSQPFTLVEEKSFREFTKFCLGPSSSLVTMPLSHNTIRQWICQLYETEFAALKERLLKNESKISFVIDCWTSSNQFPFQGVIGSWIDENWEIHNEVLDLQMLEGEHTGKNIAKAFDEVLQNFDIWNKLLSITTDNASNMDTFFVELEKLAEPQGSSFTSKDFRIRCLAHIMNLACQAMISACGEVTQDTDQEEEDDDDDDDEKEINVNSSDCDVPFVSKIRKGVAGIRKSPQRREIFKMKCISSKLKNKILILDVKTRWNSTYWMLQRCLELKVPYQNALSAIPKLKKYVLNEVEWKRVESLLQVLNLFREATEMMSTASSPTLSSTSQVYQVLFDHLANSLEKMKKSNADNDEKVWFTRTIKSGQEKLQKYYPSADGLAYIISTGMF